MLNQTLVFPPLLRKQPHPHYKNSNKVTTAFHQSSRPHLITHRSSPRVQTARPLEVLGQVLVTFGSVHRAVVHPSAFRELPHRLHRAVVVPVVDFPFHVKRLEPLAWMAVFNRTRRRRRGAVDDAVGDTVYPHRGVPFQRPHLLFLAVQAHVCHVVRLQHRHGFLFRRR